MTSYPGGPELRPGALLTGECCESLWQFMVTDTGSILAGTASERRMDKSGLTSQICHDNYDER